MTDSLPLVEASEKSGLVPFTITVTGTRCEILPLEAVTLTPPVAEYPLLVLTVSVELTAVLPLAVTEVAEHEVTVDASGAAAAQEKLMFDPLVPSTLRDRVPELPAVTVML